MGLHEWSKNNRVIESYFNCYSNTILLLTQFVIVNSLFIGKSICYCTNFCVCDFIGGIFFFWGGGGILGFPPTKPCLPSRIPLQ